MTIGSLRCDCISFCKLHYSLGYIRGGFIVRFSLAIRLSNSVCIVASLQNCVCKLSIVVWSCSAILKRLPIKLTTLKYDSAKLSQSRKGIAASTHTLEVQ